MKNIILVMMAFIIATFTSCIIEQPLEVNYDKYSIYTDSNWVEVTDIDTLNLCFGYYWIDKAMYEHEIVIKSENEYKAIFEDAILTSGYSFSSAHCDTIYKPTGVDFDKRFMIMYQIADGDCLFARKIYLNKLSGEYLHLTKIEMLSGHEILRTFTDNFSLPLVNNNAKITFDTIHVNF